MVFKVIASAYPGDRTCGSLDDHRAIRFIGGFPKGWPSAAYLSHFGQADLHEHMGRCSTDSRVPLRSSIRERTRQHRLRAKLLLVRELVEGTSLERGLPDARSHRFREGLTITTDHFGAPHLVVRGIEGPGVSFAYSKGAVWAALCGADFRCGIDAQRSDDFSDDYPYHRAFRNGEIESLLSVTDGSVSEAAALIWSAKEAAVKTIGYGFHLINPLQIRVELFGSVGESTLLIAGLSAGVGEKLSGGSLPKISLATVLMDHTWVSLAVTNRNRPGRSLEDGE